MKIIASVSKDLELRNKIDQYLKIVNRQPPEDAVRKHPIQIGVNYIPIEIIENALSSTFQQWKVEILREGQLLNSIYCTIRLHYLHPVTGDWTFHDGVGAVAIQVDKGYDPSDLAHIKSNAIMLGLPAAKSFAIKDAAEHIGKLFGRDLNRKEDVVFKPMYNSTEDKKIEITEATIKNMLEGNNAKSEDKKAEIVNAYNS